MKENEISPRSSVFFIPHGGGPLPLMGDPGHRVLVDFLKELPGKIERPSSIVLISGHWEEEQVTITSSANPPLFYDYYGFPREAYDILYPAPGNPVLSQKIQALLLGNGIEAKLDNKRGFDHGMFVPLKLMYPEAHIPCVQLSLLHNLDPAVHIAIGRALRLLRNENILIIGSGFSFHNMQALLYQDINATDNKNEAFQQWLIETCTDETIAQENRENRLKEWEKAPYARYCHPREEHLLPLLVCFGASNGNAQLVFDNSVAGKRTCGFQWKD